MSIMPTTPDLNMKLKTFWQRPEGKLGALILLLLLIGGVWGGAALGFVAWLIAMLQGTITAVELGVALFAIGYVLFNRTFRSIVGNTFRLGMRWMTGLVIEIDPIGILENTLDKMRENAEKLATAVSQTRGAKQLVESQIAKNQELIDKASSIKRQAEQQLARETNPLVKQRYDLTRRAELEEIRRRMQSNEKLSAILKQTAKMYDLLVRWQQLAEFNIDNTAAEVENAKIERKTILTAYKGLGFAQRIIRGDPEQMKLMNASLEYLAEDRAMKLGEMEDFARYSEKYLTSMDLEQGASVEDAEKMLGEYESKLLSAGTLGEAVPAQQAEAVPIRRGAKKAIEPDYLDDLTK